MNPRETITSNSIATNAHFVWLTGAIVLGIALVLLLQPQALQWVSPESLPSTLAQMGVWGPVLYIATIALSVVVSQIPGAPLAVAAGAVWDPAIAGTYTIVGGFGGAVIAYSLGKIMGPSIIAALTGKTLSFSTEYGESYLGWAIFATRLLPVFSFDLVSYGAGMTGLSFPVYASATFFGMVPSTLLLTYLGGSLQLGGWMIVTLAAFFTILFVGIPLLLHRYNWLNVRALVRWE